MIFFNCRLRVHFSLLHRLFICLGIIAVLFWFFLISSEILKEDIFNIIPSKTEVGDKFFLISETVKNSFKGCVL